jgi:tRNA U34 5-carboxymethylaminomethyl modifying enzyme MnmG/GidA
MPHLALFASKNLKYETVEHLDEHRRQKEQTLAVDRIQIDVNYEVYLDLSPELVDFWFIYKHF